MEFIAAYSKRKGNKRLNDASTLSLQSVKAVKAFAKRAHSILVLICPWVGQVRCN